MASYTASSITEILQDNWVNLDETAQSIQEPSLFDAKESCTAAGSLLESSEDSHLLVNLQMSTSSICLSHLQAAAHGTQAFLQCSEHRLVFELDLYFGSLNFFWKTLYWRLQVYLNLCLAHFDTCSVMRAVNQWIKQLGLSGGFSSIPVELTIPSNSVSSVQAWKWVVVGGLHFQVSTVFTAWVANSCFGSWCGNSPGTGREVCWNWECIPLQ